MNFSQATVSLDRCQTEPLSCSLTPEWFTRILKIATTKENISCRDILEAEQIYQLLNKKQRLDADDCWHVLETVFSGQDDRVLKRMVRTATLTTLMRLKWTENYEIPWSRLDKSVFPTVLKFQDVSMLYCFRQRMIQICPNFILDCWIGLVKDIKLLERFTSFCNILEYDDLRLIGSILLKRTYNIYLDKNIFGEDCLIEPFSFSNNNKSLSKSLQLQINQISEATLFSSKFYLSLWRLAVWVPGACIYQICNTAVSRQCNMLPYVELIGHFYQFASFCSQNTSPSLVTRWIQDALHVSLFDVEKTTRKHPFCPQKVSFEAFCSFLSQLLAFDMNVGKVLVNPLEVIHDVFLPLPIAEDWIPNGKQGTLEMIFQLLQVILDGLNSFDNIEQVLTWFNCDESSSEDFQEQIFNWLKTLFEQRWMLHFALRSSIVDAFYQFIKLPQCMKHVEEWLNRPQFAGWYSKVIVLCLAKLQATVPCNKLKLPLSFRVSSNLPLNVVCYLYLREAVTIGEVSPTLGTRVLESYYQVAINNVEDVDYLEKDNIEVRMLPQIARQICCPSEPFDCLRLWKLVFLQKLLYLSSVELENLSSGILSSAVQLGILRDSIEPWIEAFYEKEQRWSQRESIRPFAIVFKFILHLFPLYWKVDNSVLLSGNEVSVDKIDCVRMALSLITFYRQGVLKRFSTSRIYFALECIVEAISVYSTLTKYSPMDEQTASLWNLLFMGLLKDLSESENLDYFLTNIRNHSNQVVETCLQELFVELENDRKLPTISG